MIDNRKIFLEKIQLNFSNKKDQIKIKQALELCIKSHFGQKRRSGEAYWEHPVAVANILLSWNVSASVIIGALLHDVLEDSAIKEKDIKDLFGYEVLLYVYGMTNSTIKFDNTERILELLEDSNILLIKLADRLHNMRTMESMLPERQKIKSEETLTSYVPIARIFHKYELAAELKTLSKYFLEKNKP